MLIALYFLAQFLRKRFDWFHYIEDYLMKKLFFSAIIRYMIESYLKVLHNSIFYFIYTRTTSDHNMQINFSIFLIIVFLIFPLFVWVFLICFRQRLDERKFNDRFSSMYLGNKTDSYLGDGMRTDRSMAFLYSVPFCIKRICFVLCFVLYRNSSGTETLFGMLITVTIYAIYISHCQPHEEFYLNHLETFN